MSDTPLFDAIRRAAERLEAFEFAHYNNPVRQLEYRTELLQLTRAALSRILDAKRDDALALRDKLASGEIGLPKTETPQ
jgi:hypothetical protein